MLSRYRTVTSMSTSRAMGARGASLLLALALAGCPDPGGAFEEYAGRVPDAQVLPEGCPTPSGPAITPLPNVTGDALFALRMGFAGGAPSVQMLVTHQMSVTGPTGTVDFTMRFLKQSDRTLVDGAPAITRTGIPVAETGQYCLDLGDLNIPAESNPLMTGPATAEDVFILGTIKSADLSCGDVTGRVVFPSMVDLAGSTFGSIRVATGTTGSALPAPVAACPAP